MPLRFWWVTNIPTPYRNFTFERMHALLPAHGIDFRVLYMAWSEPRRTWRFTAADLKYPAKVYGGFHRPLRGVPMHLNPELLFDLRRNPVDAVMVGGYSSPSHALAAFVTHPRTATILGVETNPASEVRSSGPARWLKHHVMARYDAYLVPQQSSRDFVVSVTPKAATRTFFDFPNLIDPAVFRDRVEARRADRDGIREKLGVTSGQQLWLCPARLAPEKGIAPFLETMKGLTGVRLVIAGDGPLRGALEEQVREASLPVTLFGNATQDQMVELYAAADLFVLPSLGDPSPLSTIEATAAGLPLVLSPRIGNATDVLDVDRNGWALRLEARQDAELLRRVASTSLAQLREMGRRSLDRFHQRFDPDTCIVRLAADVTSLVERKQRGAL
ncbi:MAG: glycosyltransferase family 4 protein [Myxococcales bacterium]|nr:glycosyltransferase family 4 protein [Myxococcales bacterium]